MALDAKRPIVLSRPGIEPGRLSARISHSAKPNPKGALAWVYVMWSDEELGKAVFGKVVD